MVRAPAHALTRSTGFALLKPASRPQLDSARIVTLSGTIALNLLAINQQVCLGGIGAQGIGEADGLGFAANPEARGEGLRFALGPFKRDLNALPASGEARAADFGDVGNHRRLHAFAQQGGGGGCEADHGGSPSV